MTDGELILRVNVERLDEVKALVASLVAERTAFRAVMETEAEYLEAEARIFTRLGDHNAATVAARVAANLREALR